MKGIRVIERNMFYGAEQNIFEQSSMLRKNMTLTELILWKKLKDRKVFKVKFRRQHPIDIFIVDFYCHELKLVIEIDGEIHSEYETKEYDLGRTAELEKYGIIVLRFSNNQVIYHIDNVINKIQIRIRELAPL